MRVALADHGLVQDGVVVAGRVSGGEPGRDAQAAEHQRLGCRELLAVAGLDVEQEPVHRIPARRHGWQREGVGEVVLQVVRHGHHGVELVGGAGGHSPRQLPASRRQRAEVLIRPGGIFKDGLPLVGAQALRRQIRDVGDDRIRLARTKLVGRVKRAIRVLAQPGHRRVEALDRIRRIDHRGHRPQDAEGLDERAAIARRRGRQKSRRHVGLCLAIEVVRCGPHTVAVRVEDQAAPVRGRAGAHVHHRRVAEAAAKVEVDAAGGARRVAAHLHERKSRALHVAAEAGEVRQRDDERRDGNARRLRHSGEPAGAGDQRHDSDERDRAHRSAHRRVQPAEMRGHPERGQARHPERDEQPERVIPRVDRGEIEDREADPQARVAVASSLQVEARDRDEKDREVGLRQDAAEQRKRRIGDDVEQRTEDQRGEERLAPEVAPARALAIAHDVSHRSGGKADRRDDVVLAVEDDREHRDGKGGEDKRARFHRVFDGRAGQAGEPEPLIVRTNGGFAREHCRIVRTIRVPRGPDQSGHEVPTRSNGTSVSTIASPTTQALFAFAINAGSAVTTISSSRFVASGPEGPEGPVG